MGVHILLKAGVLLLGRAAADEHQPRVLVPGGGIAAAAGRLGLGGAGCAAGAVLIAGIAALAAGRAGVIILSSGAGIALFTPVIAVIAAAAAALIHAEDFVFIDAGSTTLELVRALEGEALQANYVTNGVAHARTLAQKGCRVFLPGGLLRPQTEAIVGAAAVSSLQQYNFTKAFMGANGVALEAGFTTPDPEEAAVKATVVHRARESWFLVDDAKFARICPAVIADLHSGAILTNRCPNPKYKQYTLVKETEE